MKKFIILFILIFLIVFLVYEFIILRKYRKIGKKKKDKYPMEVLLLMNLYKLDIKKVNYNKLLHFIALVSSLDIAIIVSIMSIVDIGIIQIIIALVIVIPIIMGSYYLIYLCCKKKYL